METIIRNVRDIVPDERRTMEHVLGQQLQENQQLIVQIVTPAGEHDGDPQENMASSQPLPDWCNVFAGMNDNELAEVENVILQRSDLSPKTRPPGSQ